MHKAHAAHETAPVGSPQFQHFRSLTNIFVHSLARLDLQSLDVSFQFPNVSLSRGYLLP